MSRLADFIKPDSPVEEVFTFPDQPTVTETVARMAEAVITGDDPEDEALWAQAAQMDAPNEQGASVRDAFDRGARLRMPDPPADEVDPAIRAKPEKRPRIRPTISRPAGSDQFTDLFAAGMIVLISFTLGDEFQPTEEEAKDLARPLGNILARRIDLAKTLGQDANDIVAFSIAVMAYGVRVGPVAAERVRGNYRDRQQRLRTNRISGAGLTPDGGIENSVSAGTDAGTGTAFGASATPVDAIAQARDAQLRVLNRDINPASRRGTPLAANG